MEHTREGILEHSMESNKAGYQTTHGTDKERDSRLLNEIWKDHLMESKQSRVSDHSMKPHWNTVLDHLIELTREVISDQSKKS